MNSTTHDYDQSSQMLSQTIHPHEQSVQHQQHLSQYRCSHNNKIHEKSQHISNFQPNSVVDYPYVLLPNQHIRDLTDVYRREKNFLEQQNEHIEENEESEPNYYAKEHSYNIPCTCETSLPRRIFQSNILPCNCKTSLLGSIFQSNLFIYFL